jgi:hypothetical protein
MSDTLPVATSAAHDANALAPLETAHVALIKSLSTNNRFYTLAPAGSGIVNAGTVEEIPHDLLLGIAYPCLEDGLNDFCVVRTAFETMELFPGDGAMQSELQAIVQDARQTLTRRLMELLERIIARKAHFLGTDLGQLKTWTIKLIEQGVSRYDIDTAMKVNVFSSVALSEQAQGGHASPRYRYEFHNSESAARLATLDGREFLVALFADVLDSVLEEDNYTDRHAFDKHIFQQFIALLFLTYSATNPIFFGTHKDDYGVSSERDMTNTPLYRAVNYELRRLAGLPLPTVPAAAPDDWEAIALAEIATRETSADFSPAPVAPQVAHARPPASEEAILAPIAGICAVAHRLQKHEGCAELSHLLLTEASRLVQELKIRGTLSPLAYNPGLNEGEANN